MERFELHIEAESRIRWKVYVRFGGEFSETDHSNMARRRLLSLHLKVMSIDRNVSAIKQTLQDQIRQYPATCGIKVNTSYNSSMGEITVNAALKSSQGGEYDLVYVLVTDGLTASGGNETSYDYTVRAISNNYLSMSTDGRFTVNANEEHTAATFSISNAKNLNPATSRVVVYALRKVDDAYMVDNITEIG